MPVAGGAERQPDVRWISAPSARAGAPMVLSVELPFPLSMRLISLCRMPEAMASCCWVVFSAGGQALRRPRHEPDVGV